MLHFWPAEPIGQVESMPKVHFTEHTGWPIMSMLPVQTPLSHSVEVSLTVTQVAPNVRGAGPPASGPGAGVSPEQATRTNDQARRRRCMAKRYNAAPPPVDRGCDHGVTDMAERDALRETRALRRRAMLVTCSTRSATSWSRAPTSIAWCSRPTASPKV